MNSALATLSKEGKSHYLDLLKESCLRNISLANRELEEFKTKEELSEPKTSISWFKLLSPKQEIIAKPSKDLLKFKSNVCRQIMISKKLKSYTSKKQSA